MSDKKPVDHAAKISAFQLAMIILAFVSSVRLLPVAAEYGFSCIFYYLVAILCFLIPSALVSAELATGWPGRGGVYVWVKEALGARWGFLAIWLQFLTNIVFLPAFLSFVAATFAYIFMPQLADNKIFLTIFILVILWGSTFVSFGGMKLAGWINTFGYVIGTLIPLIVIVLFGILWLVSGQEAQIQFTWHNFFPHFEKFRFEDLVFLSGIIFGFCGMEVAGAHAPDVKNVQKNYFRGVILSIFFVACISFGALAVATVVPQKNLSLVAGVMQAFTVFFAKFHIAWAVKLLAAFIVFGAILASNSTVIGPSKGLFGAATGGEIPPFLTKLNSYHMPVNMFIFQAIVASIMTLLILFMPAVNTSYWLIMAIVTIIYMVMYLLMFTSVVVLRYKKPDVLRGYRVPGKKVGVWLLAILGFASAIFGMIISFLPPEQIPINSTFLFETILLIGVAICLGLGLLIYALRKPHWVVEENKLL